MKGVIWKIEDKKSTVLFTNGDFRIIPTPEGAEIGTVVAVSYNRKALYALAGIAALLLIFACIGAVSYFSPDAYIDITYEQKKGDAADTQVIVELAVNRYGRIVAVRSFSAGGALVVHSLSLQHQKMEAGYAAIVREGSRLPKTKSSGKAQIAVTIAQRDLEKAETVRGLLLQETSALEADTGHTLSVRIDVYQIKKNW